MISATYTTDLPATTGITEVFPDPQCPWPSEDVVFIPYTGDCTKYYECFEGRKYEYTCPDDLWWHQAILVCDRPGDYCDPNSTGTRKYLAIKVIKYMLI